MTFAVGLEVSRLANGPTVLAAKDGMVHGVVLAVIRDERLPLTYVVRWWWPSVRRWALELHTYFEEDAANELIWPRRGPIPERWRKHVASNAETAKRRKP